MLTSSVSTVQTDSGGVAVVRARWVRRPWVGVVGGVGQSGAKLQAGQSSLSKGESKNPRLVVSVVSSCISVLCIQLPDTAAPGRCRRRSPAPDPQ